VFCNAIEKGLLAICLVVDHQPGRKFCFTRLSVLDFDYISIF